MPRILPGVEINVVKEIVAPAVAPSGVLGMVGITDGGVVEKPTPVGAWPAFLEKFGTASAFTMPEAKQAIMNGIFELVVVRVDDSGARKARILLNSGIIEIAVLDARAPGTWSNELAATIKGNKNSEGQVESIELTLSLGETSETFTGLVMDPKSTKYLFNVINDDSDLVTAMDPVYLDALPESIGATKFDTDSISLKFEGKEVLNLEVKPAALDDGGKSNLEVKVVDGKVKGELVTLTILRGNNEIEVYQNKTMNPDDPNYLVKAINDNPSSFVKAAPLCEHDGMPNEGEYLVTSPGTDPTQSKFIHAIDKLEIMPNVDMVIASMPVNFYSSDDATNIHSHINAHCLRMSDEAKNRIGLGTTSPEDNDSPEATTDRAIVLSSERFVLTAPHGVLGAVAGLIGSLDYYRSPTFKKVSGITKLEYEYAPSELRTLIKGNVLALEKQRKRGIIIEKGITTSGEQISVTRVADHAVRGVKGIADLFIGTLNSEEGRMALKQKITEFFLGMEKEGAIVPSVDGAESAFKVDVYSSEQDFGQGIVRVEIAVRPVRAIDYIYATIKVEV